MHKYPKTPELIEKLKPFWKKMHEEYLKFQVALAGIETEMREETGINGIEFFECDGDIVGIGNYDRSMELIHDSDFNETLPERSD